jgi:hypothetical protein
MDNKGREGKVRISRDAIRKSIESNSQKESKPIEQVIKFTNDDVPNYLKWLNKFREESGKVRLVVK